MAAVSLVPPAIAQISKKSKEAKGPRALGLLELSSDGKAHLIPIAIMVDGKFYDAGAYKASPVPLALWSETVYEGEKTGVPQGLFTVGGALQRTPGNWLAEGKWRPAGSEIKTKKPESSKPKMGDEDEGPPTLRRGSSDKPDSAKTTPAPSTPPADDKKTVPASAPPAASSPQPQTASKDNPPAAKAPDEASSGANDDDPNRPILKRGKPETEAVERPQVGASTGVPRRPVAPGSKPDTKSDSKSGVKIVTQQTIPAISDAHGPDPRPYSYDIKPEEEQKYRKGMLALASKALLARVKETTPSVPGTKPARPASARRPAKTEQPTFDDVQFRAFDLWNTNEPVFVLSATAHMSQSADSAQPTPTYYVTFVAKNNIYDELIKLYAGVTDDHHLDQIPRLELIDAVDADGDGRGELLFRRISDAGSAWGVYRAGADQLFPLFEGTPGP